MSDTDYMLNGDYEDCPHCGRTQPIGSDRCIECHRLMDDDGEDSELSPEDEAWDEALEPPGTWGSKI